MKNLRLLRESAKMSQQKLADQMDLAQSQIHQYESGLYEPDIFTMTAFADFFDTSIDYLVGRTDVSRKIEPVEKQQLNGAEKDLVERYRRLRPNQKKCLSMYMEALTGEE